MSVKGVGILKTDEDPLPASAPEGKLNHGPTPRRAAFANCFVCLACDTRPDSRSIDPALDYVRCPHPCDGSALCRDDISAAVSVAAGTSGLVYFLLGRLRLADVPRAAPGSFRSADRENAGARRAKGSSREIQGRVSEYKSRAEMETDAARTLAPFAQKSGDSRGRKFAEPSHAYRTEFQRDRARIIHSRAFRRLEYKTQVFLNGTGDHLRTRLTHTIEVASISRTIARALRLNEDLAEAIALGHDLGHSPFGHSGEEMLAECMRDHGGFDHNRQSLRVVELLEEAYPDFPGLNLTFEVREGLRKHDKVYEFDESQAVRPGSNNGERGREPESLGQYRFPSLEAQIADLADEI